MALVVVSRTVPVLKLLIVTLASTITAPLVSVAVPLMSPVDAANAGIENKQARNKPASICLIFCFIKYRLHLLTCQKLEEIKIGMIGNSKLYCSLLLLKHVPPEALMC